MNSDREILKTLSADNIAELVNDMRDWFKDCEWQDLDEEDIDAMSDEELIRGIEKHYGGGLVEFINANQYV